ncbi:hypothetical protein [Pseudooceanicola sp. C21-150M6]|uniref:hypothetical protein n=1 Tax=Pseudooceanicola sp. C21-150M6 TaxID=3434355 RepID=UPI003D7FF089
MKNYQQLVAAGLWRETPDAQRRDVSVTIGEATLTLRDTADRPVAHWSIPAITRVNPGRTPAIYHPDGDPEETLELDASEQEMIQALDKLRHAVTRRRPRPGRLRLFVFVVVILAVLGGAVFWLPGALKTHLLAVMPAVKRQEIGMALMEEITRVSGPPCNQGQGQVILDRLAERISGGYTPVTIRVVPDGVTHALMLPGRLLLLSHTVIEDYEEPDVAAGFAVAESLRADLVDPLGEVLDNISIAATLHLVTTGELPRATLRRYARQIVTAPRSRLPVEPLLERFRRSELRATPFAYALDMTGETTLRLIESDPYGSSTAPILIRDADWLRLQNICGG